VRSLKYILLLLVSLALWGCSSNDELPEMADTGEQDMYRQVQEFIANESYSEAVRGLQLLESRYPFGKYAEQAQLELIYAHYQAYEHEAAVEAADRFIRLHPQNPNVDYAYYMKGLSAYSIDQDIFDRFVPTEYAERDTSHAKEAFGEFSQLVARFPASPYAADARARMVYLRNMLARHEILVANYYFRRGAYLAATNRGTYVVENFPQTPAVADGLAVMAQGYILLGYDDLARDTIAVLALNYPDHSSLDENGEFQSAYSLDGLQRSWINKASFGLFDPPRPPQFDSGPDG
jgi:outer membrane protein assembly factor BamD